MHTIPLTECIVLNNNKYWDVMWRKVQITAYENKSRGASFQQAPLSLKQVPEEQDGLKNLQSSLLCTTQQLRTCHRNSSMFGTIQNGGQRNHFTSSIRYECTCCLRLPPHAEIQLMKQIFWKTTMFSALVVEVQEKLSMQRDFAPTANTHLGC